jgi:hypothetical protein
MIDKYFYLFLTLALAWTIPWKGFALWKAARLGSKKWFITILILNTLGILEIIYIFIFSERNISEENYEEETIIRPRR